MNQWSLLKRQVDRQLELEALADLSQQGRTYHSSRCANDP